MEESIPARYVFMTLIAIADQDGDVIGTDVAIARRINMPLGEFRDAVASLMRDDPDSNSKDEAGKRIIPCSSERGYHLVNYGKYRGIKTEVHRKDYMRKYMHEYRTNGKTKNDDVNSVNSVNKFTELTSVSASVSGSSSVPNSKETYALKTARDAKNEAADEIKRVHASEVAGGEVLWDKPENRQKYRKLKAEAKAITERIAASA